MHAPQHLGILELTAAHDASESQMFEAAKNVSAFWFPREMTQGEDFAAIDPRRIVSRDMFSMSGAQSVRQLFADNGHSNGIGQPQDTGGSCGV